MEHFFETVWSVLLSLSPSLLIGIGVAGLLHILVPAGMIGKMLSGGGVRGVLTAAAIGVPMPLCSCGVIPTALSLRKEGASEGATVSFLISTPQTGVDSILVTQSFLGWPFTLFKLAAAFVTGTVGGLLAGRSKKNPEDTVVHPPVREKIKRTPMEAIRYGVLEIMGSLDLWLILGVVISALITILIPPGYLAAQKWAGGLPGMLAVLAVSVPLYVCTTGSVPIAAGLVAAGMPLGTALVFLMAGPATNAATIGAVYRTLGKKVLAIYLGVIIVFSIGFGMLFGSILPSAQKSVHHLHHTGTDPLQTGSAILVSALMIWLLIRRAVKRIKSARQRRRIDTGTLIVKGMTCQNCVRHVRDAVENMPGVKSAEPDLNTGILKISGTIPDRTDLEKVLKTEGYSLDQG